MRESIKNSRVHLIDEVWINNENDRQNLINTLKDEKVMQFLRVDPSTDEFLMHLIYP